MGLVSGAPLMQPCRQDLGTAVPTGLSRLQRPEEPSEPWGVCRHPALGLRPLGLQLPHRKPVTLFGEGDPGVRLSSHSKAQGSMAGAHTAGPTAPEDLGREGGPLRQEGRLLGGAGAPRRGPKRPVGDETHSDISRTASA